MSTKGWWSRVSFRVRAISSRGRIALGVVAVIVAGTMLATAGSTRVVSTAKAGSTADSLGSLAAGLPVGSEIPSLRTQTSDTFVGDNGNFVAHVYAGPVNYKDASGSWQPIQSKLHPGSDGSVPGFANGSNSFQLELPQQIQAAPVQLTDGSNWASFSLDGATGTGSVSATKETFAGALPNVDAIYTSFNDGVNQDLVLKSPSAQRTFSYTIRTSPGLSVQATADGSITFTDSGGQAQFTVLPPIMSDANGATSAAGDASYQLSSIPGGYKLTVSADSAWLSAADRAWPVTIDPTTVALNLYMDTFIRSSNPDTNYSGQTVDKVGWDSFGVRRALLYFDVQDTLPTGVEVLSADMDLYLSAESTTANVQVGAYGATQSWASTATWNDWFPPYNWATPGGDYESTPYDQEAVGGTLGTYSWDLSELVWDWIDGGEVNNGFVLKDVDETTGLNLFSFNSDFASSNWPVLNVTYTSTVDETDAPSPAEADQSAPAGSFFTERQPTAPTQTDANGGTGSYATDLETSDETDTPNGVRAVDATGSNTWAITAAVIDDTTGNAVTGATVTLTPSSGSALSASPNSDGAVSFVDLSVSPTWTITITAPGYGTYTGTNFTAVANETYETTIDMTSAAQSDDFSDTSSDAAQNASTAGSGPNYASQRDVPPKIRVAMHPLTHLCGEASTSYTTKIYPFAYYVLHAINSEIATSTYHDAAAKANLEAISSFAWFAEIHQIINETGDLTNSNNQVCFRPHKPFPHSLLLKYRDWLQGPLRYRIAVTATGKMAASQFKAGASNCNLDQTAYNVPLGQLSQNGSKALENNCGYTSWKKIDNFYYQKLTDYYPPHATTPSTVQQGNGPPRPTTSYSTGSGSVTLNFESKASDGASHVSNVGWNYYVEKKDSTGWHRIYHSKFDWTTRSIALSHTFSVSGCYKYRVRASNPVRASKYTSFHGGSTICS